MSLQEMVAETEISEEAKKLAEKQKQEEDYS